MAVKNSGFLRRASSDASISSPSIPACSPSSSVRVERTEDEESETLNSTKDVLDEVLRATSAAAIRSGAEMGDDVRSARRNGTSSFLGGSRSVTYCGSHPERVSLGSLSQGRRVGGREEGGGEEGEGRGKRS